MKRNILILICFISLSIFATAQITVDPSEIYEEYELIEGQSQEFVGYAHMINEKDVEATFVWTREIIYLPDGWESAFCDNTRCYLPFVGTASLSLQPDQPGTSDVHVYTNGMPGDSAVIQMTIEEEGNPDNRVTATYIFMNSMVLSDDNVDSPEPSIKLYPNPASEVFYIDTDSDFDKVVLYSLVGKQIKTYPSNQGVYSLEGLPGGLYLARIYTREGKVLKTIRIHKR